jgi:ABC-type multidrug transport system fused ATPase/permease subunit
LTSIIHKLIALLSSSERRRLVLLLGMVAMMGLLDMISVAAIGPFLQVLANPETTSSQVINVARAILQPGSTPVLLTWLAAFVLVLVLASLAFKALTIYALMRFSQMRAYSLSKRLLSAYLRQPYVWFLNRHSADLGKSVLSEVDKVVGGALVPGLKAIAQGAVVVALLSLLVITNPLAAAVGFVTVVGSYVAVFLITSRKLRRIGVERVRANENRYRFAQEALSGIKEIKLRGLEPAYLKRFSRPAFTFCDRQATAAIIAQLPRYMLEALVFGGMLALVLTLLLITDGRLENIIPTIGVYAMAGARLFPALQQVYAGFSRLQFNGPAVEALYSDIVEHKMATENICTTDAGEWRSLTKRLDLAEVTFRYPESDRPALRNVSFTVWANTTVGIVGSTGAGKTTVVDLILGLLEPQQGQIIIDGVPLTPSTNRSWQRTLGYVPQQIFLVDDSVAANIALGVSPEEIDMQGVERAARIANLHSHIIDELPHGYATKLGDGGVRLSGGQRQRVGIARALYRNPSVLVLDEATSALDNLTEKAVIDAVHNIAHAKTVIIIAHRLSTVRNCDKIVMLKKGEVAAEGTYDNLLDKSSDFERLANPAS